MAWVGLVSLELRIKNIDRLWCFNVAGVWTNLFFIADRYSHIARRGCVDKADEVHGSDRPLRLDHSVGQLFGKLFSSKQRSLPLDLCTYCFHFTF